MSLHLTLQPILAIIAGILILVKPSLLNHVIAIFLIIFGILGLIP
jgi:threonine/homoserine efflux transporter RhtA